MAAQKKSYRRPESVLVVVYTAAAEVLLLKRVAPVFWQSVTGGLEAGESTIDAAKRELLEETGMTNTALIDCQHSNQFEILSAWRHRYPLAQRYNTEHVFICPLAQRCEVLLSAQEHSEYCWIALEQAIEKVWSWSNREALEQFVAPRFGATTPNLAGGSQPE